MKFLVATGLASTELEARRPRNAPVRRKLHDFHTAWARSGNQPCMLAPDGPDLYVAIDIVSYPIANKSDIALTVVLKLTRDVEMPLSWKLWVFRRRTIPTHPAARIDNKYLPF
ncbi:hypothetical protein [Bradyrhizobium sp. 2S1]|uniref:hypothetical protein n=1 Tax=Bradyrhizobium sp. 2S1 TaxID=1404429 RepID=UPI00140D5177|nr:hypothetical protein [Bradyrhizobium sp. 2S1]MCK7668618.1 hypothetical protein [Bradyrhizobium sp. 2S1]